MSIAHPVLERHTICLTTLGRTCPVLHLILSIILNLLSQLLGGLDWPLMSSCLQYQGRSIIQMLRCISMQYFNALPGKGAEEGENDRDKKIKLYSFRYVMVMSVAVHIMQVVANGHCVSYQSLTSVGPDTSANGPEISEVNLELEGISRRFSFSSLQKCLELLRIKTSLG